MERIVDGILFSGKYVENAWDVRSWEKNGVLERSARQVVEWSEVGPVTPPLDWETFLAGFEGAELAKQIAIMEQDLEEKRLRSLKKSAERAKTMCRRVIISERFDELLTLTYRENQKDRALCKKHFSIWSKRMKRALGDFRYCASFEVQERGSMHVHIACHKLPKTAFLKGVKVKAWELGTRIWRDVVGANNGLCFVGGSTKFGGKRRNLSLAKMAAYVSKYITKDFKDAPEESNRYSRSNGTVIEKPTVVRLLCDLRELIEVTFELSPGDVLVSHRVGKWKDSLWLCTENRRSLHAPAP